ncbi:MAG: VWA domain-containing protein [Acidobacteriota bacterium]
MFRSSSLHKVAALVIVSLIAYRVSGHPPYMNLYALDARSMPALRTDCTICHATEGTAKDPNFLSEFGQAFKKNGFRISGGMRDRFKDIFVGSDEPVSGVSSETLRFETAQVAIKVTVTNARGQLVTGLDRQAFQVLEDGRQQDLVQLLGEDSPLAVAMVIDTSGSALAGDLERWRRLTLDLAEAMHNDDTLAIYTFADGNVEMKRDYSSDISDLKQVFAAIKTGGNSPFYDAVLRAATDLRKRPERRRALVLLTDGSDSGSRASLRDTESQTFLAGVAVYPIDLINTGKTARRSVERQAAGQTLERLATETGGRYLTTPGGFSLTGTRGKLKRVLGELVDELHSQYTIVYEPENSRRSGRWRTIQIQMEQSDLSARTRLGYREGMQ